MLTKAKKSLLVSLSVLLCVMLVAFGLSATSIFARKTADADGETASTAKIVVNGTEYGTFEDARNAATPDNEVVTYTVRGKVDISSTGWVYVINAGLENVKTVKFVGETTDAELSITSGVAILADEKHEIDVSFENLTLSKLNPTYEGDYGHATNYFTTWLRNTNASENTVTYTNCTFPNGVCNNQYGKTAFNNCKYTNTASGLYNMWVYGGNVEVTGGEFTGVRGVKAYTEADSGSDVITPIGIKLNNVKFESLTEKAAVVVSKAANVTMNKVAATDCTKGLLQKDISDVASSTKYTIEANGSNISGEFNVTGTNPTEVAETEFNISSGEFTKDSKIAEEYYAENVTITKNSDGTFGVSQTAVYTLDDFIKDLVAADYNYDGNGKTVTWSPVSGCYDSREGHTCSVNNVAATGNTPKRVNSGLTQFQMFEGLSVDVTVKNVNFVYVPAAFTVCENSSWKGTFTAEAAPAGQLYFMTTGSVTFENCNFEKTVLTSFNTTSITTVKDCSFKNVYNNYAVKDARGEDIVVTGCSFENCGAAVMISAASSKTTVNKVTITGNTFKNVDVAGTAPEGKVGTRGLVQIAKDGDYSNATLDVSENTAETCGPVIRQLNNTVAISETVKSDLTALAQSAGSTLYTADSLLKGTKDYPYTREEFGAMTRAEYIKAQEKLGGTMYVTVGNYSYETKGVLGNGVRDDTVGQIPDHSKLNAYGENGYLGDKNDGANGKNVVFVNGSITSNVTGYNSIDNIGTALLLAVPAYTNVTFNGITFNNVMNFDYQLYTSPWSQLGELKFDGCTFNALIVGSIAAQTLTFNGCTFNEYTNTVSANNSNPTWIRPAYGNWTQGDNEGQGNNFQSLTAINFTDNKVTSTRPVKFERIAQWEKETTVTATDNYFDITAEDGSNKNVGMYFGSDAKFDLVVAGNNKSDNTAALYTGVYSAPNDTSYAGLPAGTTVKDTQGNDVTVEANVWKSTEKIEFKTTEELVEVINAGNVSVKYATLAEAFANVTKGDTVKLLADITLTKQIDIVKALDGLTLDGNGKTITCSTTTDPSKSGGSALYFGNASDKLYCTGIKIKDLTMTGMARFAIFLCGGTTTEFTNVNISGSYLYAVNLYGTHGATMTNCEITNSLDLGMTNENGAAVWSNVASANPLKLVKTKISIIAINTYTENNTLEPKIYIDAQSFAEVHTYDDGKYSGNKRLCVSTESKGTYTIKEFNETDKSWVDVVNPVAQIASTYYQTLAAAIAAAKNGETVKLVANVEENITVAADKDITLDLNGFTIDGGTGTAVATIHNLGTLTITDTSESKQGTIKRRDSGTVGETSYYVIRNNGTMTIEQAIVENNSGYEEKNPNGSMVGSSLICNGGVDNVSTLTINGGEFTQMNFIAIKNDANGKLYVNGGTITSNHSAVQNWCQAELTGGTIRGQLWTDAWAEGESVGNTVIGGEVDYEGKIVMDITGSVKPTLAINGGTLNVTNWGITPACANAGGKPSVSGGTFSSEVNKDYLADGFVINKNKDNKYAVSEGSGLKGAGADLKESLAMRIELQSGTESSYLKVYYVGLDGNAKNVKIETLTDGYYLFDKIMPQMIDVKFTFELYGTNDVMLDRKTDFSMVDYLAWLLKEYNNDAYKNLAASLMGYANAAKNVKGLDTINPEFVDSEGNKIDLEKYYSDFKAKNEMPAKESFGKVTFGKELVINSANVVFNDAYTIVFNLKDNADGYTYKLVKEENEEEIEFVDGVYSISVDASNLSTKYTIKVYNTTELVQTVTYGVSIYCIRMQGAEYPYGDLYKATYYYGLAVNGYQTYANALNA